MGPFPINLNRAIHFLPGLLHLCLISPQNSPHRNCGVDATAHMTPEQRPLYFFLWSFAMVTLLEVLHLPLFSWNGLILFYLFWPKSFDPLLENNSLCCELIGLAQIYIVDPVSYLCLSSLANLCLAPYAFYLTFSLDISPYLPQLPLGVGAKENEKKKNESKLQCPIRIEDPEIVGTDSLDSAECSTPEPLWQSPPQRHSPKVTIAKKPIKIEFVDPGDEGSLEGLLSNSYEYLQEHRSVSPPWRLLATAATSPSRCSPNKHRVESRETLSTPQPQRLPQSTSSTLTPQPSPRTVGVDGASRQQVDYLTKLQRVARQWSSEKKRRSVAGTGGAATLSPR
jgi:hypothetical protein